MEHFKPFQLENTDELTAIEQSFKAFLSSINHPLADGIKFDSGWQQYRCPESRNSKTTARYNAHSDGAATIKAWCGKCGISQSFTYQSQTYEKLTEVEQREIKLKKAERERIEAEDYALATKEMNEQWNNATNCTSHIYFERKQLLISASYGLRIAANGTLLCPVFSIAGDLISIQRVYLDNVTDKFEKRFFKGLSPKGGFMTFGNLYEGDEVYFAEGVATAITIHHSTNKPVICVYGKHFDSIAPIIAASHPNKRYIYCADATSCNERSTSEDNAKKAIDKIGGNVYIPNFSRIPAQLQPAIPRSDYNDLFTLLLAHGLSINDALEEVSQQLTFQSTPHTEVLQELTKKIVTINFKTLAGLEDDQTITRGHFLIITVEEVLRIAVLNSWGICRNHDFIYVFNGAYWSLIGLDDLKTFLGNAAELMGVDKFKARHFSFRDQLYRQFMALANLPKPEQPKDVVCINLKNGTFVITPTGTKLLPFNRSDFITYQLPFDYNPEAKAPLFEQYLNKVIPDLQKQYILAEYLGYVFVRSTTLKLEKTLLLYGTGANGKSVFYEVVRNLLGKHNTSEYSLQSLTNENGYYRAMIANKLVNYASEINGRLEASIFKQLVSGEPVEARLPHGIPFILEDYAKMIFNCNDLPKDVEQTEAYFRRFLIIPFDVTIPESEQDKQLPQKIISTELSGIFNWVLEGLQRLLDQKQFTDCDAVQQARKQYEIESDSVKLYLQANEYSPSSTTHKRIKDLYIEYREFCTEDGYKPVSKTNFIKRLKSSGIVIEPKNVGNVAFVCREY